MPYKLAEYHGDTLAVPQLVLSHLAQTDGDTIRAALYILQTGDTEPRSPCPALRPPSVPCNTGPVLACWSMTAAARPPPCRKSRRRSTLPA